MAKKTWVAYRRGEAEGGWEVRIVSRIRAVRQMQERMAKYRKPGESVVEELLRDRRPRLKEAEGIRFQADPVQCRIRARGRLGIDRRRSPHARRCVIGHS